MKADRAGTHFRFFRGTLPGLAAALAVALSASLPHAQPPPQAVADSVSHLIGPDTGATPAAPVEVVNLSAQAAFSQPSARVGDSLDYVLRVEWPETGVPVVVLAPDSIDFPGFTVLGQATSHKKAASSSGGAVGITNRTEFTYRLRAKTPGAGKAASLKVRYLTGLSRNESSHYVPTAHLDIQPGRTPLVHSVWFKVIAGLLTFGMALAFAWIAFKAASRKRATSRGPAKADLKPDVLALKPRLRGGDSKAILLDMEALCIRFLRQELGDPADGPAQKFDPLLDRYLASQGGAAAPEWAGMRELFRHARFAGGHKEPHELQDAYRALKKCLKITDEPGED